MEEEKFFYLDNQKRIITDITIINTKLVNQSKIFNSEYILYIIKIISPFNSWHIKKRYSEIKEIYDFLIKKKPKLKFPEFPPKRLFSTKESTIIERKNRFEEIFIFILKNVEILKYNKLIDFFQIKKTLLVIYIKNCILVNENRISYETIDDNSSNSSCDLINISNNSDKDNKEKKISESIKIKIDKNNNKNQINEKSKNNEENKEESEQNFEKNNKINDKKDDNSNNNINDIINNINFNGEEENTNNVSKINIRKIIKSNTNYFKCYEEFKLASGNYTSRSQVSFFIIKELLRNLKVHSSHIFEIISDFTDYIKLKKKWKKFNEKEIISLFIGIYKDELYEDYYQSILKVEKPSKKNSSSSIAEKSTLSSTPQSISNISNISRTITNISNENFNNIISKENDDIIDEDMNNCNLEGLFYYIGKYEENYFGARSCLLLLNKIFERDFNPEIDIYIKIFKKIDIKYIKKMNLCKLYSINNCINQKLSFNLINIYTEGYNEKKQIKILKDLNADSAFINKFLDNNIFDNKSPYNL